MTVRREVKQPNREGTQRTDNQVKQSNRRGCQDNEEVRRTKVVSKPTTDQPTDLSLDASLSKHENQKYF